MMKEGGNDGREIEEGLNHPLFGLILCPFGLFCICKLPQTEFR